MPASVTWWSAVLTERSETRLTNWLKASVTQTSNEPTKNRYNSKKA